MTLKSFGRATPIQTDMLSLVGYEFTERDLKPATTQNARNRAMMSGLHDLRRTTGADFGYDAAAWRDFLIQSSNDFGYTHPYAFENVDRAVQAALIDPDVVATLEMLARS